jgi:hypothetical protein
MTEVLGISAPIARGRPFANRNPGRPKGVRHMSTLLCEKLMRDDAKEIVQAVIVAAKAGDMVAAKIVLDRISPARKGRPIHFELPEARTADDVAAALKPNLVDPRGLKLTKASATHEVVLQFVEQTYTYDSINNVFKDPASQATSIAMNIKKFHPRRALERLRKIEKERS